MASAEARVISAEVGTAVDHTGAVLRLLAEGHAIPYIARSVDRISAGETFHILFAACSHCTCAVVANHPFPGDPSHYLRRTSIVHPLLSPPTHILIPKTTDAVNVD